MIKRPKNIHANGVSVFFKERNGRISVHTVQRRAAREPKDSPAELIQTNSIRDFGSKTNVVHLPFSMTLGRK